jgi:hypothetical protein
MKYTGKEILDHLEASSESFLKIDKYHTLHSGDYYCVKVCSKQLETPFRGDTVREALTLMMDGANKSLTPPR